MIINQVTLPCRNYDESVQFYRTLGLRLIVDSPPRYARFETDSGSTLSVHAAEAPGDAAEVGDTVIYFEVDNVDLTVRKLEHRGLEFDDAPVDQPWLWREAYIRDPAGNWLCIYHAGDNRRFPPWRIASDEL